MRVFIISLLILAMAGCTDKKPQDKLTQIRTRGELIVVSRNSPTTYYEGQSSKEGLEYDLARLFARYLGVRLRLVVMDNIEDIITLVAEGKADLAAAGLTVTDSRKKLVQFGPVYQTITQQLVYRMNTPTPKSIEDILDGQLEVTAGSSHAERLNELKKTHPDLQWRENRDLDSEELMNLVLEQVIDYTVADSNEVALSQRYHKELLVAFDLSNPQTLAWAFTKSKDESLTHEAQRFFKKIRDNGRLAQLIERYYGHVDQLDFVGTRLYLRHIKQILPKYQPLFERAARKHRLDWRLLAAIGYQESNWRARAVSPTGVRGIMMLTQNTAKQVSISNRLDPEQSIMGGAKYFQHTLERIPDRIPMPDRLWLALAAYNVGYGHLEDARILTQKRGGDPDKWIEVKKDLPLLSQRKWYKQTRFGYARGREPIQYVENVRIYYDLLKWIDDKERRYRSTPSIKLPDVNSPVF